MLFLIERAKKDGQEDSAIIKILTIKLRLYCFYLQESNEKFIFSSSTCVSWGLMFVLSFFMASAGLLSDIKTTSRQREKYFKLSDFFIRYQNFSVAACSPYSVEEGVVKGPTYTVQETC